MQQQQPMRMAVGAAAAEGFRDAVTNMPLRLSARFSHSVSGNKGDTVNDATIRPALVTALNALLGEGMQPLTEQHVSVKRQLCNNGAFITMRVDADTAMKEHLSDAVQHCGALALDWGRQEVAFAVMQPGGDASFADMLMEVACDGPIKPTALRAGLQHIGVDAKWAVRVEVPDEGQGEKRVVNPWGPDELLAQPPQALVQKLEGRDDSYSYLVLAGGGQRSQQKVNELVAASMSVHRGVLMGGDKRVESDALTLRVRMRRLPLSIPAEVGAQLGQQPATAAQGPATKRVAPTGAQILTGEGRAVPGQPAWSGMGVGAAGRTIHVVPSGSGMNRRVDPPVGPAVVPPVVGGGQAVGHVEPVAAAGVAAAAAVDAEAVAAAAAAAAAAVTLPGQDPAATQPQPAAGADAAVGVAAGAADALLGDVEENMEDAEANPADGRTRVTKQPPEPLGAGAERDPKQPRGGGGRGQQADAAAGAGGEPQGTEEDMQDDLTVDPRDASPPAPQ